MRSALGCTALGVLLLVVAGTFDAEPLYVTGAALVLLGGRDHALPDDVQALAPAVLAHRIMLVPEAAGVEREQIVADAVAATPAL